jgi:hypothetical protein
MSEDDNTGEEINAEWEEVADPLEGMAPAVRLCLERGNAIRVVKHEIHRDMNQFVEDLLELYPGHEDSIRKGLEGAAAQLLATRDKRKLDERRLKAEAVRAAKAAAAAAKAASGTDDSDEPATNTGANGVSGTVLGSV